MAEPISEEDRDDGGGGEGDTTATCDELRQPAMEGSGPMSRKEKRKAAKKMKRKQLRKEAAAKEREEEEARMNDPEERRRVELMEKEEEERRERERKEFEERERAWIEAMERKRKAEEEEEEEERARALEESRGRQVEEDEHIRDDGDDWEYVEEEGPAEIIWQGNEIIVKKKTIRVPKKGLDLQRLKEDDDRPTSNPLPPQSDAYLDYKNASTMSAQEVLENVALQVPNFGTEQDKAHCPFHLKTGACRFGQRCSRVHFYPDKSCTLLIKNMYNGPGLAWEQDEGLEVNCEFINVTRWKVAICGEYMKSRFKTCSHGTACNFIHCFRNPGGDYEWADWDKSPPKYWVSKMAALFGYSPDNYREEKIPVNVDRRRNSSKNISFDSKRGRTRRSRSREKDYLSSGRSEESHNEKNSIRNATQQEHDEEQMKFNNEKEKMHLKSRHCSHRRTPRDEDGHRVAVDTDEERWHGDARKRSRHRNDSVSLDENGDVKRTRYRVESDGSKSDLDEDEEAHRARSRRHTKRHKTIKHEDRSERSHGTDFPSHHSRRDGHDGYSKHRSSKSKKRSRSSDNDSTSYDIPERWDPEKDGLEDSDWDSERFQNGR